MTTLKERVAAASGADRELDLAIWNALNDAGETWRWFDRRRETIECDRFGPDAFGNPICSLDPFTASLDAALALVEAKLPGWAWSVSTVMFGRGGYVAGVGRLGLNEDIEARAPTPALALLSALLAALEQAE